MTTIIEHDIERGDTVLPLTAAVAIIAILFIVGTSMYVLRIYPFNGRSLSDDPLLPSVSLNTD